MKYCWKGCLGAGVLCQILKSEVFLSCLLHYFVADTAPNSVIWKPVESQVPRLGLGVVGRPESMQSEGSEDSPNSTPSVSPHSLTANPRVSLVSLPTLLWLDSGFCLFVCF